MNAQLVLYLASVFGAIALWLLMPRGRALPWWRSGLAAMIGVGALGAGWLSAGVRWWGEVDLAGGLGGGGGDAGLSVLAVAYYYVFSGVAILSAVRVITHTKPVYSALWFVMVVVATSGLLVSLAAEFMAFAMLIIYGGAILVTYMFVIMLASQSSPEDVIEEQPEYDRASTEPVWAVVAGFVLLAALLSVGFDSPTAYGPAKGMSDGEIIETRLAERLVVTAEDERRQALSSTPAVDATTLSNSERLGLDLFEGHPLAIELAGVILLVALIGAVVIAKTKVPEEIARNAAATPGAGGATVTPTAEAGPDSPEVLGSTRS
ncbi:MAG: NADH-quinone oxidoreductase subunit J [Planctomycetota bacterium]